MYFCDPQSPWQRGSNENTTGLLRQYFPKGTDLASHSADDLAAVAAALNTRPRKTLGWKTPAEVLDEYLATAASKPPRPAGLPGQARELAGAHAAIAAPARPSGRASAAKAELRTEVFDYIEIFFNRRRRHSTLGFLSPGRRRISRA